MVTDELRQSMRLYEELARPYKPTIKKKHPSNNIRDTGINQTPYYPHRRLKYALDRLDTPSGKTMVMFATDAEDRLQGTVTEETSDALCSGEYHLRLLSLKL